MLRNNGVCICLTREKITFYPRVHSIFTLHQRKAYTEEQSHIGHLGYEKIFCFSSFFFVMTIIHNLQTWCRRKNKKSDIISIKFPTSSSLQSAFHLKPILTLMTQFIYVQVKCENRLYPPHPTAFHGLSFHKPMNLFYHFTPFCRSPSFCVNWECLSCFIKAGSEFPFKSIIL